MPFSPRFVAFCRPLLPLFQRLARPLLRASAACILVLFAHQATAQNTAPKVTWHWHMHQPIYWNDQLRAGGVDRYEYAWDSIVQKDLGSGSPENDLREIFGKDDRVAAYQYRMRDALGSVGGHAKSGATTSYSGALMENVASLGAANQLGYGNGWSGAIAQANGWDTSGGKPRLDIVNFTFHHSLAALHNEETVYMEMRLQQEKVKEIFGAGAVSNGAFPTEMCFSERLIPVYQELGIDWAIVSGEHVARACPDFPLQLGSGGVNCAPPNRADQINPNGVDFFRGSISRGCSPVHANPLSYQPAYAKYIDPATGAVSSMIVVPSDQTASWNDGYQCIGADFIDALEGKNNPAQPSLVVLTHDGDNAFAGGFSYYTECVSGMANDAVGRGGEVTAIEQYLADFPPSPSEVIHVEDGGWVNADGDFGSPTFINWNYPLLNAQGQHDPVNGWHEKPREMAIFTAALNRVLTAQQKAGTTPNFAQILHPGAGTHPVDRAWHYFLGSLDSGNVYFGTPLDLEIKGTIGCNEAFEHVDPIIGDGSGDLTPPTIWLPQRFPYNPGSLNYGVEFQYKQYIDDGDFHIWTFVSDVNPLTSVVLKYRTDVDGTNPIASTQNETFAGGAEVGAWVNLAMNGRAFPNGNVYNKPELNYYELPAHIADHYSVAVTGLRSVLIDYYVEATDSKGNVARSPIQHVYVGDGNGATGGNDGVVTTDPAPPVRGEPVTITYNAAGRPLQGAAGVFIHHGKNNWSTVVAPDPAMTGAGSNLWNYTYTVPADATQIDMVFRNAANTYDNNGGQDWHITTEEASDTAPTADFTANLLAGDAPLNVTFTDLSTGQPNAWAWDFDNDGETDSTARHPSHTFTDVGVYTVKLTASNANGSDSETKSDLITVSEFVPAPLLTVSKATIAAVTVEGENAAPASFAVSNSGTGTLSYSIDATDTTRGAAPSWMSIAPTSGTSTGEPDTITLTFATDGLSVGTYHADITVVGNATNSPKTIAVTLDVQEETPGGTTVVPNPPTQGETARVWYNAAGGPIAGTAQVVLHWGINGGATGGGAWVDVTDTPMTMSGAAGMWFADLAIPATATSLNFVTNNGNDTWDNNGSQNWNFAVQPSGNGDVSIVLNRNTVNATASVGENAGDMTFTVANGGSGQLDYEVAAGSAPYSAEEIIQALLNQQTAVPQMDLNADSDVNIADVVWVQNNDGGPSWLQIDPTAGSSGGEADTITLSFLSSGLATGEYTARLDVTGNADNSPQSIDLTLTITDEVVVPNMTSIDPDPPTAGQMVRVWYVATGGPIDGATQVVLHWSINAWTGPIVDTDMTESTTPGTWYADIALPGNATQLDFAVNNGAGVWDNNGMNDWHFAVTPIVAGPSLGLSRTAINTSVQQGGNPADETFTVSNDGGGTLNYTAALVDTGDGTAWLNIDTAAGSSMGEADTITVDFDAATLGPGFYMASIEIDGNGDDTPRTVTVSLTVTSGPSASPITIGAGPAIGTNVEGVTYYQELQDWTAADLRGLDTLDDTTDIGDAGYNGARDIAAFYSRFEDDNLYLRVDLLELGILAEQGHLDVYVLIDCASGGTTALPDSVTGGTTTRPWDIAVATYDGTNAAVKNAAGGAIAGAHLGSYWRSDLDAVEFGVTKAALLGAGWDGSSDVYFNVFTARDFDGRLTDSINFAGGMSSSGTTGRAKFASIAHGNQSLNRTDGMRDRIYISAASTGTGAPSGFRLTLDTHTIFQIPLNIHMSGTLISAIGWIVDANPVWDGQAFLERVGSIVDADQSVDPGALVGGVFSEHIMPFFNGSVNRNSIDQFNALVQAIWGIGAADMKVMHTPERVINSVAAANGADPWDDIVASDYTATYIDEVAHVRNWLYPGDAWTGIGGEYGIPRQHKIHQINGVYCFLINDNEDQYKFWPQDGGANETWRRYLLYKALDTDQAQLTLIFDDWEAMAGYSFGSGYNDNALNYNAVMRWVANHPWIEVVALADILGRATDTGDPQYDADWIVEQGDIGDKPFDTYDYLQHATEDSYANWYYGSGGEESFRNAVPTVAGDIGAGGTPMPSGKVFGEMGTGGTLLQDTWAAVQAAPQNALRTLAETAFDAMIFETAWHDEDNTNYARTSASNYHAWSNPDTTFDKVSGWAYILQNHVRDVTVTTTAAAWANSIHLATRPAGVTVTAADLDQDGENEYVLANETLWLAFEARGGRCVQAYYFDAGIDDAYSILGSSPINNPSAQGEEERTSTASRCSAFKETNDNAYADVIYGVATGASSITFTSPGGQIVKTIGLATGTSRIQATYTNNLGVALYTRLGVGVNNLDLLHAGANFTSSYTASTFTQDNATRGSLTVTTESNASINELSDFNRFVIPLTEQVEVQLGTGASSFRIDVAP